MEADPPRGLGRCRGAFWLALAFDVAGFTALLAGVFADVFFADLLIYGGGVGVFFSLLWWVFWYVGNLEVPPAELQDDVGLQPQPRRRPGKRLVRLVRSLSSRFSGFSLPGTSAAARARGRRRTMASVPDINEPESSGVLEEQKREGELVEGCS